MKNDARIRFDMPAHLASSCAHPCLATSCAGAVKQEATTGRWFITIGHAGFNTTANNTTGYATEALARVQVDRRNVRAKGR